MNDVHKVVAEKLRSAASALLADARQQPYNNFGTLVNHVLHSEVNKIQNRAAELDPKPEPPEPTAFGSMITARLEDRPIRFECTRVGSYVGREGEDFTPWVRDGSEGHYSYDQLRDVEVLRIGVGEAPQIYDRTGAKHKQSCEWPDCPGNEDCEGLSLLSERTLDLTASAGDTTADEAPTCDCAEAPADADEFMTAAGFDNQMTKATPVDVTVSLARTHTRNINTSRFCGLSQNCRMAEGHDGGCKP